MSRKKRLELLEEIEKIRNSKIIVYFTGDRKNLETRIGDDVIPIFQDILINSKIRHKKIDLMIYSRGGNGPTALTLVSLIREYCDEFNVIIPWKAHSAATLIALGANSIIMLKSGQLSPVDVNITTPFNPKIETPVGPQNIPINVEDLSGYVRFSKDFLGIKNEQDYISILQYITEKINPLAIGAVYRAREKNMSIASNLLRYHLNDENLIKKISDTITMGLFEHSFLISKRDAIRIKLPIEDIEYNLEKKLWNLFIEYYKLLNLDELYNQEKMLGDENKKDLSFYRALIEHIKKEDNIQGLETYIFTTKRRFIRTELEDPVLKVKLPHIIEKNLEDGWIKNNEV
ncbi:MAG: SDH family Clp fold serine proteinase [Promethearchaeota archaeon]